MDEPSRQQPAERITVQLGSGTDAAGPTTGSVRLGDLFESAPVALIAVDASGAIRLVNPPAAALFGRTRAAMLGLPIEQLLPERLRGAHARHRQDFMAGPGARPMAAGRELIGLRGDGSEFALQIGLSSAELDGASIALAAAIDLSPYKQTEALLEARVARRTRQLDRRRQVAAGLRDTLELLNAGRGLDEILAHVVRQAAELLDADRCAVYRLHPETRRLEVEAAVGIGRQADAESLPLDADSSLARAVREHRPIQADGGSTVVAGPGESLAGAREPRSRAVEPPAGALGPPAGPSAATAAARDQGRAAEGLPDSGASWVSLALPLLLPRGKVYGALEIGFRSARAFDDETLGLASSLADQAALALENDRLRGQAARAAVTAERNRIARDLHDSVTQTLFSASMIAEVLPRLWERDEAEGRRRLDEMRQLTRGALAEMRALLLELRPTTLAEVPLAELLAQLGEATAGRSRLRVELGVDATASLPYEVKEAYYRIAQEALNNVAKHAQATQAWVAMELEPAARGRTAIPGAAESSRLLVLTVRDNGRGFDPLRIPADHLGLTIMRERADAIGAELSILTRPSRGTSIRVAWPCPDEARASTAQGA
ncbi:MAG: GAF domain-containing protein [Caldilineae bacterium]|nr:GAF domain-containing protein [Caldilineae bacterium]